MKSIITLFLVLASLTITAKDFYKAKINMADETVIEGYAELPSNKFLDNSVQFKETLKSKARKIKNDEISSIIIYSDKGQTYYFERNSYKMILKPGGKAKEHETGSKFWMLARYGQPSIIVFYVAQKYYFDKDDVMISQSNDSSGTWAEIGIMFKRPGEDAPTQICSLTSMGLINQQKTFRNTAKVYFKDDTEFTKRIDDKEFKSYEAIDLAKAYAEYKAK